MAIMKTFKILSIDGGGFLGLATAAFIRGIEDHFQIKLSEKFDMFCGTSTGAILSLALASGKTGGELVDLYTKLGEEVFPPKNKYIGFLKSLVLPKFRNTRLRQILTDEFEEKTLDELYCNRKHMLITSFCLTTGIPRIFKTNHSANLTLHGGYKLVDIALASSAAPMYFPLVKICNPKSQVDEVFCDGGVASNHPALLGFTEALSELRISPEHIQILSLSTPRIDLSKQTKDIGRMNRGLFKWKKDLASVFIDSNSYLSNGVLRRMVDSFPDPKPLYVRIELENKFKLEIDNASQEASEALISEGSSVASQSDIRNQIKHFI